jgi:hypothetical protein
MATVFWICALVGGTILVLQFFLTLTGLGGDMHDVGGAHDIAHAGSHFDHGHYGPAHHDATHDQHHGSNWFFGIISFRTVVAALAFFGLGGLASLHSQVRLGGSLDTQTTALALAVGAGAVALLGVHALMRGMSQLRSEGTVRIERAIGQPGTVYLRIPGNRSGTGKIQVSVQNRTMEYAALTSQAELPTGAKIVVLDVIGPDTVEVALADSLPPQPA